VSDTTTDGRKATTIRVYKDELETLKRAKRRIEYEVDGDLAMGEALTMLAETYLEMAGESAD